MMSQKQTWTIVATILGALIVLAPGCSQSILVPSIVIDRITVTDHVRHTTSVITDSEQIHNCVAFIQARRGGWKRPWDTFPSGRYDVAYESNGNFQYVVWISVDGADWIGYRKAGGTSTDNVLKNVSAAEHKEIIRCLGR